MPMKSGWANPEAGIVLAQRWPNASFKYFTQSEHRGGTGDLYVNGEKVDTTAMPQMHIKPTRLQKRSTSALTTARKPIRTTKAAPSPSPVNWIQSQSR